MSGYQLVTTTLGANTTTPKSATATCPAGKVVVGGGFTTTLTTGTADRNGPASSTSWTAQVRESQTGTPNWSLTVTAICVTALP